MCECEGVYKTGWLARGRQKKKTQAIFLPFKCGTICPSSSAAGISEKRLLFSAANTRKNAKSPMQQCRNRVVTCLRVVVSKVAQQYKRILITRVADELAKTNGVTAMAKADYTYARRCV